MAGRRWTEEEIRLGLYLYFQLPFGKLHSGTPEIRLLAEKLDRTPSSIAMKLCNFASLDPEITKTGRSGLDGASKLDRKIFTLFQNDWSVSVIEASSLWKDMFGSENDKNGVKDSAAFTFKHFDGPTTEIRKVEQRIGQNFFRRAVLANYDGACCITGIADSRLLNASHIKPWNLDETNRHNPANGFALSATFDRAFDRGLITITDKGIIKISRILLQHDSSETRECFSPYQGHNIRPAARFRPEPHLLAWHNDKIFIDA